MVLIVASSSSVFAWSFGPPGEKTGAPGEGTCANAGCHTGNPLNATGGSLMLTVPENYTPGQEYDIVVELARAGQKRWGFQMTALNSNNARAGTFAISDDNTKIDIENSKQYIEQTSAGSAAGTRNSNSWTFKWTAPSTDVGRITFYTAGNAADGTFTTAGDYIYSQKETSDITPVYGVSLEGVGSLSKTVSTGSVTRYTLRVINNGNTRDTINLSTTGISSASLSRTSVTLAADASANVTLTIPGTALRSAGEYEVKVTATSQSDSSKTAETTTTTTIPSVYGVNLSGANLTQQREDASTGVSYTLRITNTGNTNDTFSLTTSGDATATISPRSPIFLSQGASRTLTLRISGTALEKAGVYNIKVTATSQNDSSKTDEITTTTTILPVYDIALEGVGELTTETADASEGVSYTLKITNNGNSDDKVDITTAGDVAAVLSNTELSIAYGASANVTLTISGDVLAKAGEYNVKVIATSQGDSTKTTEITTTTTILPVYDIMLEGVGELTTETADASEGVSYTLKITNDGNTNDTIDLTTEVPGATLSQTSVSLTSGASTEVMLTISGEILALADDYIVKVTATSQGDDTQTDEVTTTTTILPVYNIMFEGVGELTTETTDASEGVSYTLKITNDGNTNDTIDLATEGTEATLSQMSVSLTSGASVEVMLSISGDVLVLAGNYEVKVTATSQGDDTQTVEATTTTTVLPVYGVTLASDTLTGATMDANTGVTYTLTVTNIGNTDDTIVFGSSAEVGIGGAVLGSFNLSNSDEPNMAQLEIMLAAGATADVMFIAAGDFLTQPGEYEITVAATSQGDTEKTAEITTTTTIAAIPPEYGVQLQGVGELSGATWNFLKGVTYTLTITNTGNTEDTIVLGSSAEVGIGGAVLGAFSLPESEEPATGQLQITLDTEESVVVNFTASGDLLTQPGEYEIVIMATSQGDNTKTVEITTTTTIEHVPWDLNADGKINILDLVAVANQFGETGDGLSGDVNMDGTVNILDMVAVANQFGKTPAEIVQATNQ